MLSVSTLSRKGFFHFRGAQALSKADAFFQGSNSGDDLCRSQFCNKQQSLLLKGADNEVQVFIMVARPYEPFYDHNTLRF
jgi:hypothetical protein